MISQHDANRLKVTKGSLWEDPAVLPLFLCTSFLYLNNFQIPPDPTCRASCQHGRELYSENMKNMPFTYWHLVPSSENLRLSYK